jgi:fumarylpyruvate hydrolase
MLAKTSDRQSYPVRRVFCVGRNYASHAAEMGGDPVREPPFFFTKWAEAVVPSGTTIAYPPQTKEFHYEAELVVAIGSAGRNIPPESALDHIYGYAAGLDMTRRDLQSEARAAGRPWDTAKNFEQSAPLGTIHPASEVGPIHEGTIELKLNGQTKQRALLAEMIWPIEDVITFLSRLYRIEAGDLIYTGTPAGVASVVPGDEISVSVSGLSKCVVTIGNPILN